MSEAPDGGLETDPCAPPVLTHRAGVRLAGRWELRARLGGGAMGSVWRAFDHQLGEEVALKLLGGPASLRATVVRGEVAAARAVTHPNVCRVFDVGEDAGACFVSMELVPGGTLRARMEDGLPPADRLSLLAQLVAGVAAAHAAGVVHRDVKPDNVMVTPQGRAVVVDFGLASRAAEPRVVVGGTPAYLAPEASLVDAPLDGGDGVDARRDVFAIAVLAAELLTGARPAAGGRVEADALIAGGVPARAAAGLARLLTEAIAIEPAARPASAVELARRLDACLTPRRRRPVALAVVVLLAAAAVAIALLRTGRAASTPSKGCDDDALAAYVALGGDDAPLDRLEPALAALDHAIAAAPRCAAARAARALTWLKLGHRDGDDAARRRADEELEAATALDPRSAAARTVRCRRDASRAATAPSDAALDAARASCLAVLEVDATSAIAADRLGVVLAQRCDGDGALAAWQRALDAGADPSRTRTLMIAEALGEGRLDLADRLTRELVATEGGGHHLHRAALLLRRGDDVAAAAELRLELAASASPFRVPWNEAAALRGLIAIASRGGAAPSDVERARLVQLEAGFRAERAAGGGDQTVTNAYRLVDPAEAARWVVPTDCASWLDRAELLGLAGDRAGALAAAERCIADEAWLRGCKERVLARLGAR